MKKFYKPKIISKDKRGIFYDICNVDFKNVSIITSKKNTIRSNHYHLKDAHYIYVLEGKMKYYYSKINNIKIRTKILNPGDIVFTPPLEIHTTKFLLNSKILVVSMYKRSKKFYESDTIRYELIKWNNILKLMNADYAKVIT